MLNTYSHWAVLILFPLSLSMFAIHASDLELIEERVGRVSIGEDEKLVELTRNVKTKKISGSDAWGNRYGVVGNTSSTGEVIDPSKEIVANVQMTDKRVGRVSIGEDGKLVELMRNVQSGKLSGSDAWGNRYGVVGNTSSTGEVIDPSKEIVANVVMLQGQ